MFTDQWCSAKPSNFVLDGVARTARIPHSEGACKISVIFQQIPIKGREARAYGEKAARDLSDNNAAAIFIIEGNTLLKLARLN